MTRISLALAAVLLAVAAGCAQGQGVSTPAPAPSPTPPARNLVPDGYTGRFRVAVTVLENRMHGPQMCLFLFTSYPPQCYGPDIVGWTWDGLRHTSENGTTWGGYLLTGTFDLDARTFTLTEPAAEGPDQVPPPPPADRSRYASPCPTPAGGWTPVDLTRATDQAFQTASIMVSADPDFAGLWLDQEPTPGINDPTKFVLNVKFTKDLARHEAEIRTVWGGALCLSEAKHTQAELAAIQTQLSHEPGMTSSSVDVTTGTLEARYWVASQTRQAALDSQYGPGLVTLVGEMQPID